MRGLCILTALVAVLLAAGEIARWWGDPRMVPLVLDELIVAAALAAAAWRANPVTLAAAWGLFCGLVLSLLVPTLDHLLHGPPKESAGFYAAVLGAMLALGAGTLLRALALAPRA